MILSNTKNGSNGIITGFKNSVYKIFVGDTLVTSDSSGFTLKDEGRMDHFILVHKKNMEYHEAHPPSKTLEPLDFLGVGTAVVVDKVDNPDLVSVDTETIESKHEEKGRYSVILLVDKAKSNYDLGFKYRVWNLYTTSSDKKHLIFYGTLLIENGIDKLYENGYIRFYWAHANGNAALVPVEQLPMANTNIPDNGQPFNLLKQPNHTFRQMEVVPINCN